MRSIVFANQLRRRERKEVAHVSPAAQRASDRSRLLVVGRSETAIIGYAAMSLLATISISYYCLTDLDKAGTSLAPADTPVYEGRAVPRADGNRRAGDSERKRERVAHPAIADHDSTRASSSRSAEQQRSSSTRNNGTQAADLPLYSFPELEGALNAGNVGIASSLGGGVGANASSAQAFAPDAETVAVAPVPESGAWPFVGVGALLLCARRIFLDLQKRCTVARTPLP